MSVSTTNGRYLCPVCASSESTEYEFGCHLIQCGLQLVRKSGGGNPTPLPSDLPVPLGKRTTREEAQEEDTDQPSPKQNRSKRAQSSPQSPRAAPSGGLTFATADEYDEYLRTVKENRYKRTGAWKGMKGKIDHVCTDPECGRKWKPSPDMSLSDDYHCPSCVLHHRNNESRWENQRLAWTAEVPNTFYVFSLVDPGSGQLLYKFGRTQNVDPLKRYPSKELNMYKMKLIHHCRDTLRATTGMENWWKAEAEKHHYLKRHSDKSFHGCTECIQVDEDTLNRLLAHRPPPVDAESP